MLLQMHRSIWPDCAILRRNSASSRKDLPMQLDRFDRALMQTLQREGRITNSELAARINLSESACLRRVRALEAEGLIEDLARRGVIGGLPASRLAPDAGLDDLVVVAATELDTAADRAA